MKNLAFAWLEPPGEKAFSSLYTPPPADPALTCPTPWSYHVCLHSPCSVDEIQPALPSTQPPACLILPPNGLLSGPTFGASEQEGHLPGALSTLWAWASSHLSLLVLPPFFCLCLPQLPPSQLPPSQLPLHGLSLVSRSLPFLSRSPGPTLHLLLPSLPCLPSLNVSPYLLRPLLKSACDLLPPLTLPHLPLFHSPDRLSEEPLPGLRQLWPRYCLEASGLHRRLQFLLQETEGFSGLLFDHLGREAVSHGRWFSWYWRYFLRQKLCVE